MTSDEVVIITGIFGQAIWYGWVIPIVIKINKPSHAGFFATEHYAVSTHRVRLNVELFTTTDDLGLCYGDVLALPQINEFGVHLRSILLHLRQIVRSTLTPVNAVNQ